jgi:RNA polymerase sigma-70 factor (ECF subfamily)
MTQPAALAATHDADEALIAAFLRDRDPAAFGGLFDRHTPALYALAVRLVGGPGREAEDVVQETWVRAVERFEGFGWRSQLRTWLLGIAINCARELLRRRSPGFPLEAVGEPAPAPQLPLPERIDLERALRALPDGYRAVVVLHDVLGLTHAEIGERLAISPGTSKSQLSRARRALRAYWRAAPQAGKE